MVHNKASEQVSSFFPKLSKRIDKYIDHTVRGRWAAPGPVLPATDPPDTKRNADFANQLDPCVLP